MAIENNMAYRSVTIPVGGTAYIPNNAVVIAYSSTGDATINSECLDLSQVGQYVCFELSWITEVDDGGGTGPWNETDPGAAFIKSFNFKGNTVIMPDGMNLRGGATLPFPSDDNPITTAPLFDEIDDFAEGLFQDMTLMRLDLSGEKKKWVFYFQAPSIIGSDIYMEFDVGQTIFRVYAISSDRCEGSSELPTP